MATVFVFFLSLVNTFYLPLVSHGFSVIVKYPEKCLDIKLKVFSFFLRIALYGFILINTDQIEVDHLFTFFQLKMVNTGIVLI